MNSWFTLILWTLSASALAQEPVVIPPDLDEPHDLLHAQISSEVGVLELACTRRLSDFIRENGRAVSDSSKKICLHGALALRDTEGTLLALSEDLFHPERAIYWWGKDIESRVIGVDQDFHKRIDVNRSNHRDRLPLKEFLLSATYKKSPIDLRISSKLFRSYATHLVQSRRLRWVRTDAFEQWASPVRTCTAGNYRYLGRGISWNRKHIAAVCEDPECHRIQLRLFNQERGCSEALGSAVPVSELTPPGILSALRLAISDRYQFEDIVHFYIEAFNIYAAASYDGRPESRGTRTWLPVLDSYIQDLFDLRAIGSILNREVRAWQIRPRNVDRNEFRRWITEFSDYPETILDPYEENCRFELFDLRPDQSRVKTTMKAWGLSGTEAFNQWEDNHELENLTLRPMMGRYMRANLAPFFAEDSKTRIGRVLQVDMDWYEPKFLGSQGFTIRFQSIRDGKTEEVLSARTSFAADEFPKLAKAFAKKLGCSM